VASLSREAMREEAYSGSVECMFLDLADLKSVAAFAQSVCEKYGKVCMLLLIPHYLFFQQSYQKRGEGGSGRYFRDRASLIVSF
jgi:hypothetical protein